MKSLKPFLKKILFTSLLALISPSLSDAAVTLDIKMDYFGYRPSATKIAIFTADPGVTVEVRDLSNTLMYTIPADGGSIVRSPVRR